MTHSKLAANKQGSFVTVVLSTASAIGYIYVQSCFNFCIFGFNFRIFALPPIQ